jgi:hypothetical protein
MARAFAPRRRDADMSVNNAGIRRNRIYFALKSAAGWIAIPVQIWGIFLGYINSR